MIVNTYVLYFSTNIFLIILLQLKHQYNKNSRLKERIRVTLRELTISIYPLTVFKMLKDEKNLVEVKRSNGHS